MKDLRLVEYAVALGRHRSFARAAESLRVTQPTLSRGIATLEKSIGARLFERTTRRVVLTATGQAFIERAISLLEQAEKLSEVADPQAQSLTGQLIIGSGPFPLEISVLPAVARLAELHPNLRIRIIEGAWRELPGMLLLGSVDIAVVEATIFANDNRVDVDSLPRHQGHLVCRPGHPLSRLAHVTFEDLELYPLVGISMTRDVRSRLGKTIRLLTVDHLTGDVLPHVATTSLHALREIVQRTDGVALCPRVPLEADLEVGRLVLLKTNIDLPSTQYGMATLSGRTVSHAALAFKQTLRQVEQELASRSSARATR
jgi:DNA-binding transcriptional LysR family regulator